MKFKKGDNVIVVTGAQRGKTGKITAVYNDSNRVLIDGVNVKKKHQRPKKQGQQGQVIEVAHPINASNVMILDPKEKKPSRIGYTIEDGEKKRISKKSGQKI